MTIVVKLPMEHITTTHPLSSNTTFCDTFNAINSVVKEQGLNNSQVKRLPR